MMLDIAYDGLPACRYSDLFDSDDLLTFSAKFLQSINLCQKGPLEPAGDPHPVIDAKAITGIARHGHCSGDSIIDRNHLRDQHRFKRIFRLEVFHLGEGKFKV